MWYHELFVQQAGCTHWKSNEQWSMTHASERLLYVCTMLQCLNAWMDLYILWPCWCPISHACTSEVHFYHRALFFFAAGCCRFHTVCIPTRLTHPLGKKRKRRVCFCTRQKPAVIETGQPKFERLVIPSPINLSPNESFNHIPRKRMRLESSSFGCSGKVGTNPSNTIQ